MISKTTLVSLVIIVILLLHSYIYYLLNKAPEVPEIDETWWGKGEKGEDDISIRPFRIKITQHEIQDLHLRLNTSRQFTPSLETIQHQYGLNPELLTKIIHILQTKYNFTERLEYLNQYPQFNTKIQGIEIHFIHIIPENPLNLSVLPILLLHGWPSSVREFYEMIPILTNQTGQNFVFELVIPSIPGFGHSSAPQKPDCQAPDVAKVFVSLMKRLNYEKFYVHGSDWGAIVATHLATLFPEVVLGFHSNFCVSLRSISLVRMILGGLYPPLVVSQEFESKLYPLSDLVKFYLAESAYLHIQGTKPDTIGLALDNSPQGLLSFVLEKLSVGSNRKNIHLADAGLDAFDTTTLLDIILFYYWFPRSATTSARFYTENLKVGAFTHGIQNVPIDESVPCGCAYFENEFIYQTESMLKDKFTNLVHYTTYESGGHFGALEHSDLLVKDIISFVAKTVQH